MSRKIYWLIVAFALCFFVGGAILWRGTYQEYLHASMPWPVLAVIAGAAVFLTWVVGLGVRPSAFTVGSSFPAILIVRIIIDCIPDPTNHNLWPFEVVAGTAFGMIVAFPAASIGRWARRITHTEPGVKDFPPPLRKTDRI